jgi:hypothetical protein
LLRLVPRQILSRLNFSALPLSKNIPLGLSYSFLYLVFIYHFVIHCYSYYTLSLFSFSWCIVTVFLYLVFNYLFVAHC